MKLRLLMSEACNRRCKGCCNKDYDLAALPVCRTFKGFDEIIITGGEPMLDVPGLAALIKQIRSETTAPIILYTAWREDPRLLAAVVALVDGLTLTLHTRKDVGPFIELDKILRQHEFVIANKSLRLNVFDNVRLWGYTPSHHWNIKRGIKWIKNCPLPTDEVFMRL